jgi:chromosome segregation ATPase
MKKTHVFLLILICTLTTNTPVFAQAYRSQLQFLEQFAVRQYERGDKESALKQFGWILRIEPDNAVAREYLAKGAGESTSSTSAPERTNQIIADISGFKQELAAYEKDTRELESLIRDLISENDALYQVLYTRSREVAELRQKFYGTPYEQAYVEAMKSLPIDRVPQRLHRSNDILPENTAAMTKAEKQEIDGILKDIAALSAQQKSLGSTADTDNSPAQQQLMTALQAKRDMLIRKTMTLAEKRDNLNHLKYELTDINTGLKRGNSNYKEAVEKIDNYYSRIKEKIAKKNYVEQKMFSELVADYARKLKEIEELKTSVRTRDNSLTSFKPTIASSNDRLRNIDQELRNKDAELAEFKTLLTRYKQQLSEHETVIVKQQTDLSLTDQKLVDVNSQVSDIENTLKAGDAQLSQLKTNLAHTKGIPYQKGPLQRKIELQSQHINNLEKQNANMAAFLEKNEQALQEAGEHIKSLEEQLITINGNLKNPLIPVNDPEKQALREELARLKTEAEQARQDVATTTSSINDLTIREQKLLTKITDFDELVKKTGALEATIKASQDDNAKLREELARMNTLEKENADLRETFAKTIAIQNENSQLRQTLLETTTQVSSRSKDLTQAAAHIQTLKEDIKTKDAYIAELSRRTATMQEDLRSLHPVTNITRATDPTANQDLEKRLRATYEKLTAAEKNLTAATSERADLKEQLAARNAEIDTLKTAPSIKGNADKKALMDAVISKDEELSAVKEQMKLLQEANENAIQNALASKNTELAAIKDQLKTAQQTNENAVKSAVASKDDELLALKDQLKILQQNNESAVKNAVASKDAELAALKEQMKTGQHTNPMQNTIVTKNSDLLQTNRLLSSKMEMLINDNNELRTKMSRLQAHAEASIERNMENEVRKLTLDLNEKAAQINGLEQELQTAHSTARTAETMLQATEEKYSALTIKQAAMNTVASDRDMKIAQITTQLQALKDELAAIQAKQKEDLSKFNDAASARTLAEGQLKARENEIVQLHDKVKELSADIKSAKAMLEKKDRDHDATLKELRRVNDLLEQKREGLKALQRRVENSIKN